MIAVLVALVPLKLASVEEIGDYAVLLGIELICTVAFGISWILKGIDLRRAIRPTSRRQTRRRLGSPNRPCPPAPTFTGRGVVRTRR
jgi:hypothetical protein